MSGMSGIETLNRAFSAAFMDHWIPGAMPQAKVCTTPSALIGTEGRGECPRRYAEQSSDAGAPPLLFAKGEG